MNALHAALQTKLTGGTALVSLLGGTAIYHAQAPAGQAYPYLVYSWAGGGRENITPSDSLNYVYYVRTYAANAAQAGSIDEAARLLLDGGSLTVAGYTCVRCEREDDYQAVETPASGANVYTDGGFYRIQLDQ